MCLAGVSAVGASSTFCEIRSVHQETWLVLGKGSSAQTLADALIKQWFSNFREHQNHLGQTAEPPSF